jgi:hypothetical protein
MLLLPRSLESVSFFALLAVNLVLPESVNQILLVLMFHKLETLFNLKSLLCAYYGSYLLLECNSLTFNAVEHSEFSVPIVCFNDGLRSHK